jgi:hypothetical protein
LSEYLKSQHGRAKPLPGTDLDVSIELVRSIVEVSAFDCRSGVDIFKQQLVEPNSAFCFNAVAIRHPYQGRYFHALPLYERALRIREAKLGPDHPDQQGC